MKNEDAITDGSNGSAARPGSVPQCGHRTPGALSGAGQDGNGELGWARQNVEEQPDEQPAPRPAPQPKPQPELPPQPQSLVWEKFRKTGLHTTPPVPRLRDQVLRKNSLKYLAGQVDSIHDRLDTIDYHLERAIARLDRRIEELEERWRWT